MYLNRMFEELKNKMVEELENVTLVNYSIYQEKVRLHHNILQNLAQLRELENIELESSTAGEDLVEEPAEILSPEAINIEEIDNYPIGNVFTFLKKASGGVIDGLNYPIPEELVQSRKLGNGNKVKIVGIKGKFVDDSPIYEFTVVDRTIVPNPELVEITHGIVRQKFGNQLIVERTVYERIEVDSKPIYLLINERDMNRLNISEGDIIDGRFYRNNPVNSFRATNKHDLGSDKQSISIESRKLSHRQNNQSESETGFSMIDRLDKTPFLNKNFTLIGLGSRVNNFRDSLDKAEEIQMVHMTGDEHKAKIRAQIIKSDFVVLSTYENSHDTTKYVAKICNEYNIPFTSTHGNAIFSVLMDAIKLIEQQQTA